MVQSLNFNVAENGIKRYEDEFSVKLRTKVDKGENIEFIVSFQAFLKYVTTKKPDNIHWIPMFTQCDVCRIKFDVMTKLENIGDEIDLVLEKMNAVGSFTYDHFNSKTNWTTEDDSFEDKLIADYREAGISEDLLNDVYRQYQNDFEFFGYDFEGFMKKYVK